jgi:hypothetical protein
MRGGDLFAIDGLAGDNVIEITIDASGDVLVASSTDSSPRAFMPSRSSDQCSAER